MKNNPFLFVRPVTRSMLQINMSKESKEPLTFSEVTEVRQQNFCVVERSGPEELILAHLTQLLAIQVLEEAGVDLHESIFFDGPFQPLAYMFLGP